MKKLDLKLIYALFLSLTITFPIVVRGEKKQPPQNINPQSTSILQAILHLFKSPENRLITRGSEVCPISPGNLGEQMIWSDRPLFIWQGKIPPSTINLYSSTANYNYNRDDELVWQKKVPANTTTIAYQGQQLQPGFIYDWEFISEGKTYRPTFIIMEQSARNAIATDLTYLEKKLQTDRATPEDIAIARSDYFMQQQLWSDALQELYSVENPSAHLTSKITEIELYLCDSTQTEG